MPATSADTVARREAGARLQAPKFVSLSASSSGDVNPVKTNKSHQIESFAEIFTIKLGYEQNFLNPASGWATTIQRNPWLDLQQNEVMFYDFESEINLWNGVAPIPETRVMLMLCASGVIAMRVRHKAGLRADCGFLK